MGKKKQIISKIVASQLPKCQLNFLLECCHKFWYRGSLKWTLSNLFHAVYTCLHSVDTYWNTFLLRVFLYQDLGDPHGPQGAQNGTCKANFTDPW